MNQLPTMKIIIIFSTHVLTKNKISVLAAPPPPQDSSQTGGSTQAQRQKPQRAAPTPHGRQGAGGRLSGCLGGREAMPTGQISDLETLLVKCCPNRPGHSDNSLFRCQLDALLLTGGDIRPPGSAWLSVRSVWGSEPSRPAILSF